MKKTSKEKKIRDERDEKNYFNFNLLTLINFNYMGSLSSVLYGF